MKVFACFILSAFLWYAADLNAVASAPPEDVTITFTTEVTSTNTVADISFMVTRNELSEVHVIFPEHDFYALMAYVQDLEKYSYSMTGQLEQCQQKMDRLEFRASQCDEIRFAGILRPEGNELD